MYRAYPSPSETPPNAGTDPKKNANNGGTSTTVGGPPTSRRAMGPPSTSAALPGGIRAMPMPAPMSKIKFGNPTLGVPPPTKKQRAIPTMMANNSSSSNAGSSSSSYLKRDDLTKLADEGIARRRAALRNLKARGQTAPSILERAKAMTSTTSSASAAGAHAQQTPFYPTRTRPIAANLSPSRTSMNKVDAASTSSDGGNGVGNGPPTRITNLGMRLASSAPNPANGHPSSPPKKQYEAPPRKKITTPSPFQPSSSTPSRESDKPTSSSSKPISSPPIGPINTNTNVNTKTNGGSDEIHSHTNGIPSLVQEEKKMLEINDEHANKNGPPAPTAKEDEEPKESGGATIKAPIPAPAPAPAPVPQMQNTTHKVTTAPPPVVPLLPPETTKTKRETLSSMWNAAASPLKVPSSTNASTSTSINTNTNGGSNNNVKQGQEDEQAALKNVTNVEHGGDENQATNINQSFATFTSSTSSSQNNTNQSATLRMVKELRKAKEDKEQAMKRLAKLESEVMDLRLKRESAKHNNNNVHTSRGRNGHRQTANNPNNNNNDGSPRRRRIKSPEPTTRSRADLDPLADREVAARAVETVEDVFASDLATYVVRKPYGGSKVMEHVFSDDDNDVGGGDADGDGGRVSWENTVESYEKNATAKDDKTIEVLAKLKADGSVLLIWGSSSCKHGIPTHGDVGILGYEFKTFGDVEYMDGSLGKIIFIDSEGNDGEYWLDPVYEEALKIRESYCSNVFSAALALKATASPQLRDHTGKFNGSSPPNNGFGAQLHSVSPTLTGVGQSPPMTDACVGTDDLSKPSIGGGVPSAGIVTKDKQASSGQKKKQQPQQQQPKKKKQSEFKEEPVDAGSVDVLPHFILFFFSSIFSIIWFMLMLPVRVTRMIFTLALIFGIGSLLWIHFADIQDAMNMGAAIDTQYNI